MNVFDSHGCRHSLTFKGATGSILGFSCNKLLRIDPEKEKIMPIKYINEVNYWNSLIHQGFMYKLREELQRLKLTDAIQNKHEVTCNTLMRFQWQEIPRPFLKLL